MAAVQAEQTSEDHLQRMRKRIEAIGRKIDQGTERLIIVPKDLIPGLAVKLRQLEQEKRELQKELHAIEAAAAVNELENRISEAENALWACQDALRAEDYPLLRQVLRENGFPGRILLDPPASRQGHTLPVAPGRGAFANQ